MKKLFLASALVAGGIGAMMPVQNVMAQEVATVAGVGKGVEWLAKRIYSLDLGTRVYEMEQDGVASRSFVAVLTAEGAIIQNYDLAGGDPEGVAKVGREPGFQILPYTVSITSDGRKMISVSAVAWKSMNLAYKNAKSVDSYYDSSINDKAWTLINNLQVLTFEWDDNFSFNNTESFRFDVVRAEAKLDILGASRPGHFLAIVGGGSLGVEKQMFKKDGQVYDVSSYEDAFYEGANFSAKYRIGLEYNLPVLKTHRLNAQVNLNGSRVMGYNYDPAQAKDIENQNEVLKQEYDAAMSDYNTGKEQYEMNNMNGQEISHDSYQNLTGNTRPELDKLRYDVPSGGRTYMYLSPSISYGGKFKNSKGLRYDISVFGNLPIRDDYKSNGVTTDLSGNASKPLVGAGIKLKF